MWEVLLSEFYPGFICDELTISAMFRSLVVEKVRKSEVLFKTHDLI